MGGVGGEHHLFWALHLKELRRCLTAEKGGFCRPHGGNMPPRPGVARRPTADETARATAGGFCKVVAALSR